MNEQLDPTPSSATASEVEKAVDTARIDALKEYLLKQGSEGWYGALDDLLTALSDSQRQLREARDKPVAVINVSDYDGLVEQVAEVICNDNEPPGYYQVLCEQSKRWYRETARAVLKSLGIARHSK